MNRERRTLFSFASARFKCSESGPLVVSSLLATLLSLRKGEIFSTAANNQPIVLKETPTRMYIYNEPLHDLTPFPDHLPTCTGSPLHTYNITAHYTSHRMYGHTTAHVTPVLRPNNMRTIPRSLFASPPRSPVFYSTTRTNPSPVPFPSAESHTRKAVGTFQMQLSAGKVSEL